MFTGIVERQGEIISAASSAAGRRLAIRAAGYWDELTLGASVAVDGVCLTIVEHRGDIAEFDVIGETLSRTTLNRAVAGRFVNLERSMRADARIDGHFVQGHVEAVSDVLRVEREPRSETWWFAVPEHVRRHLIPKGSIAVDGISLTLVDVRADRFSVSLIPTTLNLTTLGKKKPGDRANIETDILVRTLIHTLDSMMRSDQYSTGVTHEVLRRAGYSP